MADHDRSIRHAQQLRTLAEALESGRLGPVKRLVNSLTPAEVGNLLESLPPAKRLIVWELVDTEIDGEVLLHVNDEVRESLLAEMDPEEILAAAGSLETDDLVELLDDLPDALTDQVLHSMDVENRERLEQMLTYPEDTAGRLMNTDVVTVRADVSIDVVLRYLRLRGEVPQDTNFIYVISRRRQYLGRLAVSALLTSDPETLVNRVMDDSQSPIPAETSENEVAHRFANHDWTSAPVVDDNNVLLGRITIDDVVDIIREEAEHQVYGAAGLDEEEDLFSPVPRAARRRAVWLGLNLLTAFLAAWVVGNFKDVISHLVAVAVLMSVVPSMGGVAGTQTLTITVRAMALGQISFTNAIPLLWKEILVAFANGLVWALVVGGGAWFIYRDTPLSIAFGLAMVINLLAGALAGVYLPLILKRMRIDPALAGGVILTTVTDVCGYASFLGLATLLLLR